MPINGTDLINHPWNTSLEVWNNMFIQITGHGETLWIFIGVVLTFGIFMVSDKHPLYTSMFMVCYGGIIASGSMFIGLPVMAGIFTVFTGIGFAAMFVSIYLQRR